LLSELSGAVFRLAKDAAARHRPVTVKNLGSAENGLVAFQLGRGPEDECWFDEPACTVTCWIDLAKALTDTEYVRREIDLAVKRLGDNRNIWNLQRKTGIRARPSIV
jgi:hypothetical protein